MCWGETISVLRQLAKIVGMSLDMHVLVEMVSVVLREEEVSGTVDDFA